MHKLNCFFSGSLLALALLPSCATYQSRTDDAKTAQAEIELALPLGSSFTKAETWLKAKGYSYSRLTDFQAFSDMKGLRTDARPKYFIKSIVELKRPLQLVESHLEFCVYFDQEDRVCDYFFTKSYTGP